MWMWVLLTAITIIDTEMSYGIYVQIPWNFPRWALASFFLTTSLHPLNDPKCASIIFDIPTPFMSFNFFSNSSLGSRPCFFPIWNFVDLYQSIFLSMLDFMPNYSLIPKRKSSWVSAIRVTCQFFNRAISASMDIK